MHSSPPNNESESTGPQLPAEFGFTLNEESWTRRVGQILAVPVLGRIGDYELIEEIGRGGQGVVFKARQPRTGRLIAVKRLSAGAFSTPEMRSRFEREIEAAVALDHSNIVTVLGTEVVDGQPLLAMKWIDGVPIDRWARPPHESRRTIREILEVFTTVCDAVHHAHQRGVIHRDLKPSNVLVDKENRPFVLDFGLAKLRRDMAQPATITITGEFLGTPAYAAPEQICGDVRAVDVRTDVYALGVILYRLLTGTLPFTDTYDLPALMQNVLHREPPRPSTHDPALNREVDVILLKTLAKDKDQRYASVDAFADDLRRLRCGEAVLAHPPSTVYQARKFVRQHRAGVIAIAVIVLLLATSTVVSSVFYFRGEHARRLAEEQRERAEKEAVKATEAGGFVSEILSSANRRTQKGNPNVTVREVLDRSASDLDNGTVKYDPEVEASIRKTIGDTYWELGLGDLAEPHFRKVVEIYRQNPSDAPAALNHCRGRLGSIYSSQRRFVEAERLLEEAIDQERKYHTDGADSSWVAVNQISLAILKRRQGKFAEAEALYLHALETHTRVLGPDDDNVGMAQMNLGWLYHSWGRPSEAEAWMRKATDTFQRIHDESDLADAQCRLGAIVRARGDSLTEAETLMRQGLDGRIRIMGPDHSSIAYPRRWLAELLASTARTEEAIELLAQAIEIAPSGQVLEHVSAFMNTVREYPKTLGKAEDVLRDALEKHEPSLGSAHALIAGLHHQLGDILVAEGRFEEAEEALRSAEAAYLAGSDSMFNEVCDIQASLAALHDVWKTWDNQAKRANP